MTHAERAEAEATEAATRDALQAEVTAIVDQTLESMQRSEDEHVVQAERAGKRQRTEVWAAVGKGARREKGGGQSVEWLVGFD